VSIVSTLRESILCAIGKPLIEDIALYNKLRLRCIKKELISAKDYPELNWSMATKDTITNVVGSDIFQEDKIVSLKEY
jgi:hypothetical protein